MLICAGIITIIQGKDGPIQKAHAVLLMLKFWFQSAPFLWVMTGLLCCGDREDFQAARLKWSGVIESCSRCCRCHTGDRPVLHSPPPHPLCTADRATCYLFRSGDTAAHSSCSETRVTFVIWPCCFSSASEAARP